jgi:predicted small secreted protein
MKERAVHIGPDRKHMLLMLLALVSMIVAAGSLTGCNTIEGAGEDISAAGHGVSSTAEEVKP